METPCRITAMQNAVKAPWNRNTRRRRTVCMVCSSPAAYRATATRSHRTLVSCMSLQYRQIRTGREPIIRDMDYANLLNGKFAVVTGGTRGIGLAIATSLLDGGASVAVCSRSQQSLDRALG